MRNFTLAAVLCTMTFLAHSKIVYTDIKPDSTTNAGRPGQDTSVAIIDFNGDGTGEYRFRWDNFGSARWFVHMGALGKHSMVLDATAGRNFAGARYLSPLQKSTTIDSKSNWGNSIPEPLIGDSMRSFNGVGNTNFKGLGDRYVGCKFQLGTNTHYGWVRVSFNSNMVLVVKDYAYESTANTKIAAGDTGSSSSTVLVKSLTVKGKGGVSTITTTGGTLQMQVAVSPSNATDTTVIWSVRNGTGSATISKTGLLTAISDGTVTVKATANDASKTVDSTVITINTKILITSLSVSGQGGVSAILTENGTLQMVATVLPTNATDTTVTWSVRNGTGSATISSTGLLTETSDGTVTVKATTNDGSNISDSTVVTINTVVLVSSLSVSGQGGVSTITTENGTLQMVATALPANATDNSVTWSVRNGTGSATISSTGLLTETSDGTVTVKATTNDGSNISDSTIITINTTVLVSSLSVQGQGGVSTITTENGTLQMVATTLPTNATDNSVTWSVRNGTGSATISSTGLLTETGDGTVTVKATTNDGSNISDSTVITINTTVLVSSLSVAGQGGVSTITIENGTLQMVATVLPTNATDNSVTWSVRNGTGSATISSTGLLTETGDGTVTVKATTNDGSNISDSTIITINTGDPVGISQQTLTESDLLVFPNPTAGRLNIVVQSSAELTGIRVIDFTGKEVLSFKEPRRNLITLDTASLTEGVYSVEILTNDHQRLVRKVVVQ